MRAEDIIIRPILTEKGYDGLPLKRCTGKVAKGGSKTESKIAIEQLFGVEVGSVNTCSVRGKLKRMGRNEGMTASYKKAIVQLKEDSKPIEFFASLS